MPCVTHETRQTTASHCVRYLLPFALVVSGATAACTCHRDTPAVLVRDSSRKMWAGNSLARILRGQAIQVTVQPASVGVRKTTVRYQPKFGDLARRVARNVRGRYVLQVSPYQEEPVVVDYGYAPPIKGKSGARVFIEAARLRLGVPYRWGGLDSKAKSGLACMGLVFTAFCHLTGANYDRLSRYPAALVKDQTLGRTAVGPVHFDQVPWGALKPGDVLFFAADHVISKDGYLPGEVNGKRVKVEHMGIYVGGPERKFIHSRPGDSVVEEPLSDWSFDALLATRPFGW